MTDEDIRVEYESYLAFNGKAIKECPQCGTSTYRGYCTQCVLADGSPLELTGDKELDDIFARLQNGENVDLDAELGGIQGDDN